MVIADPTAELMRLVTAIVDPPAPRIDGGPRRQAELIRRRFDLSLPAPFLEPPGEDEPIRPAAPGDAAAIAAVKWRCFGTNYRGLLPDAFLDRREIVPPVAFWVGRAMLPPSRRHRLLVWGSPGRVFGYADTGPVADGAPVADAGDSQDDVGEVFELYVDPAAQGRGGGRRLLDAAVDGFNASGFVRAELSVLAGNTRAQAFYRTNGWRPTGRVDHLDLGPIQVDEHRYARPLAPSGS